MPRISQYHVAAARCRRPTLCTSPATLLKRSRCSSSRRTARSTGITSQTRTSGSHSRRTSSMFAPNSLVDPNTVTGKTARGTTVERERYERAEQDTAGPTSPGSVCLPLAPKLLLL
ncbi:hypothetical protein C8J57DRAFT_1715195 [Mycena rebaudengoi]|nr:hypothetical protein C8J57DRAFT_1715195 [Mycena rebaudengoi]